MTTLIKITQGIDFNSYEDYKESYLETFKYFNRNTKRKQLNTLNEEIAELLYQKNHLKPRIEKNGFAWLYGEIHHQADLDFINEELEMALRVRIELKAIDTVKGFELV